MNNHFVFVNVKLTEFRALMEVREILIPVNVLQELNVNVQKDILMRWFGKVIQIVHLLVMNGFHLVLMDQKDLSTTNVNVHLVQTLEIVSDIGMKLNVSALKLFVILLMDAQIGLDILHVDVRLVSMNYVEINHQEFLTISVNVM